MSAFVNFALLGLAGVSLVAAEAPAEEATCVPLADAVGSANLNRLGQAVLSLVGEEGGEALALLAQAQVPIDEESQVTIFAPNDESFPPDGELPTGGELLQVLLGHVVEAYLPSDAVFEALAETEEVPLPTAAETEVIAMTGDDGNIYVRAEGMAPPGAQVIETDIQTCVGVIHIIDALLIAQPEALGPDSMAPGMGPSMAPTMGPSMGPEMGTRDFVFGPEGAPSPSVLSPPGVPAGAPGTAPAPAPAGETGAAGETGGATDTAGEDGAVGTVASDETDGASHLIAGTFSAMVAALALLA